MKFIYVYFSSSIVEKLPELGDFHFSFVFVPPFDFVPFFCFSVFFPLLSSFYL